MFSSTLLSGQIVGLQATENAVARTVPAGNKVWLRVEQAQHNWNAPHFDIRQTRSSVEHGCPGHCEVTSQMLYAGAGEEEPSETASGQAMLFLEG